MSKLRQYLVQLMDEIGVRSGCHRLPERSFFFRGRQFPVCARCTGVAAGQLAALAVSCLRNVPVILSTIFLGIMGLDWGLQETGIRQSTNPRRLATGILGGFGLFSIYCSAAKWVWKKLRQKKSL
ncbi:DUF2085 domain-containing protein [Cuneatibacter caecimuris]|nr:DUF2085 domain-containing protein [Cuneatibacter caecimuris]